MGQREFHAENFEKVDDFICSHLLPQDPALDAALENNRAVELDAIDVAPNQGKLLYLIAKMNNAKRILEIGTLGGYSSLWFAKAIPEDGKVISLELSPEHASVARENIKNAGFEKKVEVKVGPALETLEAMGKEGTEKFDMFFIDADKENNPNYFKWALEFSKKGSVIIVDNIVRFEGLKGWKGNAATAKGVKELFELMKVEKRVECTAVQTVGSKGWDGFSMALVIE
jgi:predicted O-methyltransferase YrrM